MLLPIVLGIVVLVVVFGIMTYNGIIRLRNKVDASWSQIDVQLQRRFDLIPNLVETVKGYAAHEKSTLDAVITARNAAMSASGPAAQGQADNILTGALKSLFALAEAYPDLKANQNFLELQEALQSTEDKISYARQFYNDSVRAYNTKIQVFPAVVFAGMFGFKDREYFEAEAQGRGPVQVQF